MTLPIDPDAVRAQLEAADEQITKLQRYRDWLEQGLALIDEPAHPAAAIAPAPGPQTTPAPAAPARATPAKPASTGEGRDGLNHRQQEVLTVVNSLGSAAKGQIADRVGYDPTTQLQALMRRGLVTAEGATRSRRFVSTLTDPETRTASGNGRTSTAIAREMDAGVLRVKVLDAIRRDQGTLTVEQLAQGLLIDTPRVQTAVDELARRGTVTIHHDSTLTALTEREQRIQRRAA